MNRLFNCSGYGTDLAGNRERVRAYVAAPTAVVALELFINEHGALLEYTVEPEKTTFLQRTV